MGPMEFSFARADVVRAINQRWLLKFWKRHLGTTRVPQWQAVETENLSRMSPNLSFIDVIGGEASRFVIRFHGDAIAQVYGRDDCRGKTLEEIIPAARRGESLAAYRQTVIGGCPVYTIQDLTDRSGRLVHYERLLLPFGRDGQHVDRILASFEFICPDGAFDAHAVLSARGSAPATRLLAIIEPQGVT